MKTKAEIQKQWNDKNPEKVKEMQKRSREKHKEKRAAEAKRWREENREKYLEGHRRSRNRPEYKERSNEYQTRRRKDNPFQQTLNQVKYRAKKEGWDNNLDVEYLESIWTGVCPITGAAIRFGFGEPDIQDAERASLDRFDSTKGYVKGNVRYISFRMNRIKYDASFDELERLYNWWKRILEDETTTRFN